jgi:hypothetical protein
MKKTIIFATAFLIMLNAKAQTAHFGIKAGLNASSLSYKDNSDMQSKIGFNAGLLAHIHTGSNFWAFQPEVYYSSEGAHSKSNSNVSTDLGYINVPVLIQYMFSNGFRLEAGPQLGIMMSGKSKVGTSSTELNGKLKAATFSIPAGIGYLTSTGLGFDARYNFGISNIYKSSPAKVRSNVFQFDVFYQFSGPKVSR